jgi:MinD superfamily P-loop ATPase
MTRTRVIAVAGAKGSPGCTFVAVGVAFALAGAGLKTLLVDADAEATGIAPLLDLGAGAPPRRLDRDTGGLPNAVRSHEGVDCLDLATGSELEGAALVGAGRSGYAAVVVDVGHRFEELQRSVAAEADWLVWVAASDRIGVERADRALGAAELAGETIGLVVNRTGAGLPDAGRVLAARHAAALLAAIPDRVRAAADVIRRRVPPNRSRAFRRSFREIATALHPDFRASGGEAWP